MAKPPILPSRPPAAPSTPDPADPRLQAFLGGAQVQAPAGVGVPDPSPQPRAEQPAAPAPAVETVVKDGFSMPQADYGLIGQAQDRALSHRVVLSKSDVLRAALRALRNLDEADFLRLVQGVEKLKPGRKRGKGG